MVLLKQAVTQFNDKNNKMETKNCLGLKVKKNVVEQLLHYNLHMQHIESCN